MDYGLSWGGMRYTSKVNTPTPKSLCGEEEWNEIVLKKLLPWFGAYDIYIYKRITNQLFSHRPLWMTVGCALGWRSLGIIKVVTFITREVYGKNGTLLHCKTNHNGRPYSFGVSLVGLPPQSPHWGISPRYSMILWFRMSNIVWFFGNRRRIISNIKIIMHLMHLASKGLFVCIIIVILNSWVFFVWKILICLMESLSVLEHIFPF